MPHPSPDPDPSAPHWHQALAYALLGHAPADLGAQTHPDLAALLTDLDRHYPDGRSGLLEEISRARNSGEPRWPRVVPDQLRAGVGAAQFAAALAELRRELGLDHKARRVLSERAPDAAEQALLREVPPHHGG